ncbi:hypothetical protein [Streptomyces sp. NBC_01353]|uniref:hypothetical protein n=1 Tax=Streptomyces sp. NBC_01353 TaxID=2903835 RepID=UPI002E352742|nr:hypothetical protein [Streptomyces sp. NBC_01353]
MNSADLHPARIPGYDGGPLTHQPGFLDEPLFWLGHLASFAQSEGVGELLFGADYDAADDFQQRLWQRAEWPTFTVPLADDHRLHVVYRTFADDAGIDYLLHHPDWDQAEILARDDGHFLGPGLSWRELVAAADGALPGGSTTDPDARLLLLLPAFGDDDVPDDAVDRLAVALRSLTGVEAPEPLASALLEHQGGPGAVRWTTAGHGFYVNDGEYSYRNPANRFAMSADRLSRVATALAP